MPTIHFRKVVGLYPINEIGNTMTFDLSYLDLFLYVYVYVYVYV